MEELTRFEIDMLFDCITIVTENKYLSDWPEEDVEALDSAYQKLMAAYTRKG